MLYTGQVSFIEALGEVTLLYFGTAEAQVIAKLPGIHDDLHGQAVILSAASDKIHLFHNGQSLYYRD